MHKILLIEDDQILQKMYQNKFQNMDYQIITASDGQEGFNKAKVEKPDMVLLDLMMPRTNGIKALNMLKNEELTKDIPVAILSVVPEDDPMVLDHPELFKDIVAYWRKDQNNPSEIAEKVREYLEKKETKVS